MKMSTALYKNTNDNNEVNSIKFAFASMSEIDLVNITIDEIESKVRLVVELFNFTSDLNALYDAAKQEVLNQLD